MLTAIIQNSGNTITTVPNASVTKATARATPPPTAPERIGAWLIA